MFCPKCGNELVEGAAFCSNCGRPVDGVGTSAQSYVSDKPQNQSQLYKIFGVIEGIILLLSSFFPYISVTVFGVRVGKSMLEGGDGYIVIGFAIAAIIFAIVGKNEGVISFGVLSLGLLIFEEIYMKKNIDPEWYELAAALLRRGAGYYFLLIGSMGLIFSGIYGLYVTKRGARML